MKKKIYGLLTAIFVLFACVFASACGNKYEKAEFKIEYAFSESADNSEWYDASQGVSINFGAEGDKLVMDENGYGKVYFRVEVLNVKSKYIGDIAIATNMVGGMENLSHNLVGQKQVFSVTVSSSVQTQISFSEGNSGLNKSIDFNVYKSLISISANQENLPAITIGQTIDLSTIGNIVYNPYDTNQKGVTYYIDSIGCYLGSERIYTPSLGINLSSFAYIQEGTSNLYVSEGLKDYLTSNNVLRIKAVSNYSTEEYPKETTFDLYLAEKIDTSAMPVLKYDNGNVITSTVYLYSGEEYSKLNINVENKIESIYNNEVMTLNGAAKYKLYIYVGSANGSNMKRYGFEDAMSSQDIKIKKVSETVYEFTYVKSASTVNRIKFAYELEGLTFVGDKPVTSTEFGLTKMVLPEMVKVNNENSNAGLTYQVYSNVTSKGVSLKVEVNPTNAYTSSTLKEKINFTVDPDLEVIGPDGKAMMGTVSILSGDTIKVKFKSGTSSASKTMEFSADSFPSSFMDEPVSNADKKFAKQKVTFEKVVIADSLGLYADEKCQDYAGKPLYDVYVDANDTNFVYIKAKYSQGTAIDGSTIKLVSSSDNLGFGFGGDKTIFMNDTSVAATNNAAESCMIYKVPVIVSGQTEETEYTIQMIAGENMVVSSAKIKAVYLSDGSKFAISSSVADTVDRTYNAFALEKGRLAEFYVNDNGKTNTIAGLELVYGDRVQDNGTVLPASNSVTVLTAQYLPKNIISITGATCGYSQLLHVAVLRYEKKDGVIVQEKTHLNMSVAVYDPIGRITAEIISGSDSIFYVNSQVTGVNKVELKVSTISANANDPASKIAIYNGLSWVVKEDISISEIKFEYNDDLNKEMGTVARPGAVEIKYAGQNIKNVSEQKFNKLNNEKIEITLNGETSLTNIRFTIRGVQFGTNVEVYNFVDIVVLPVAKVDNIKVAGDLTYDNSTTPMVELSYNGITPGYWAETEFEATAEYLEDVEGKATYSNIGFSLSEYELDADGNIVEDEHGQEKLSSTTNSDRLTVVIIGNEVTLRSKSGLKGGTYLLRLVAIDSYNGSTYETYKDIIVKVSDGSKQNKYLIKDESDFYAINNGLNSYYALVADIELTNNSNLPLGYTLGADGKNLAQFTGGLTTQGGANVVPHTIKYKITTDTYSQSTSGLGNLYGLFGYLAQTAEIINIKLDVTFDIQGLADISSIGALAGISESKHIEKVKVQIATSGATNIVANRVLDFGGLIGKNYGEIKQCSVKFEGNFKISSTAKSLNAGLMVGANGKDGLTSAKITGKYLGNSSLDSINFDIVGYLEVSHNTAAAMENDGYLLAGVAGVSYGTIQNVLVAGSLKVVKTAAVVTDNSKGYVAGIAAKSTGVIDTCAALALDVTSQTNVVVGALVGVLNNDSTDPRIVALKNSKFISVKLTNSSITTNGSVSGTDKALVAELLDGELAFCGAQNFVKNFETVNKFVASGAENVTDSYIIGLNSNNIYLLFKNEDDYYEKTISSVNDSDVLAVDTVDADNFADKVAAGLWYEDSGVYKQVTTEEYDSAKTYFKNVWNAFTAAGIVQTDNWVAETGVNSVKFDKYENLDIYFPYLLGEDGKALIIIQPTDLKAELNQDYIIEIDSIYVENTDSIIPDSGGGYNISETVFVNYLFKQGDDNDKYNTYKIKDLVNLDVIPEKAQGGLDYEIVGAGWQYAYIPDESDEDGDRIIIFKAASGDTAIIVKIFSLFNPDVVKYVEFHSVFGITNITANAGLINKLSQDQYDLTVYTGGTETILSIGAENIVSGKDFKSLFEIEDVDKYIKINMTTNKPTGSKLEIVPNRPTKRDFSIKIINETDISGYTETLRFTLWLNARALLNGYDEDATYIDADFIEIDTIEVIIKTAYSAKSLTVSTTAYDVVTKESIVINSRLISGFVNSQTGEELEIVSRTDHNRITLGDNSKDAIQFVFDCVEGVEELEKLMTNAGVDNVVDLFDITATSVPVKNEDGTKTIGYDYRVVIALKQLREYRQIAGNIKFNVTASACSNPAVKQLIDILYMPTEVSTVRIENYAVNSINVDVANKVEIIERNTAESSIITPGGKGSMMYLYIEPNYANVKNAVLSTSELTVPSINHPVNLKFTQYVYNEGKLRYETLKTGANQIGNNLELSLISGYDVNGKEYFDGIIYIHAQLEKIKGVEQTITATIQVTTENGKLITVDKPLLTEFLPGADIVHQGTVINGENVVEIGTFKNSARITVKGYQFNSNPVIQPGWNLNDVDTDNYEYSSIIAATVKKEDGHGNLVDSPIESVEDFDRYLLDNNTTMLWYIKNVGGNNVWASTEKFIETVSEYYNVIDYTKIQVTGTTTPIYVGSYVSWNLLNNYTDVVFNEGDQSYSMNLNYNVKSGIPVPFLFIGTISMVSKDGKLITSDKAVLKVKPVDYILREVNISRFAKNSRIMFVGNTEQLNVTFATANANADYSEAIYEKMLAKYSGSELTKRFTYFYGEHISFDQDLSAHPEFEVNVVSKKVTITALSEFAQDINFSLDYGYKLTDNGTYELDFTSSGNNVGTTFRLNIYPLASEDKAAPIYTADDLYGMQTGQHYILMNDITLENHNPITTAIGSLDGNNRIITINSFAQNAEVANYGLFGKLGTYTIAEDEESGAVFTKQTILKNVMVNYGICSNIVLNDVSASDIVFGGLVAVNEGGLIYNSDVVNSKTVVEKTIKITLDNNKGKTITFGGLVGINKNGTSADHAGVITNSRVGRSEYTLIQASQSYETTYSKRLGSLKFIIESGEEGSNFDIVAGSFVGENSGTISSSYVANTTLVNHSVSQSNNKTAGFVATNKGAISYSYAKGLESTITTTNPYSTGAGVVHMGNGTIAGFAYENSGDINNSFANLELNTTSAYIAGFVYDNKLKGVVSASYAAATMNAANDVDDFAEQPFVGVSKSGDILSYGTLENTYYLIKDGQQEAVTDYVKDAATAFNLENFQESGNLTGFVFVNSASQQEREQGLWSYYSVGNERHILPELTNANMIAHSYRYLVETENKQNLYTNAASYAPGTKNNPYIIRNAEEYNSILRPSDNVEAVAGYIRLVNNIDFESEEGPVAIKTRMDYTLGDSVVRSNITSFDGNGMTINGVYLDVSSDNDKTETIGLFANITNAYVKNISLNFAAPKAGDQYSSTNVKYSGGLAGKIEDSAIINIKLNGPNVTLTGQNFVGGLAGYAGGTTMLYSITSNLSVKAGVSNAGEFLYYTENEYLALGKGAESYSSYIDKLSYAGGIVGVLDLETRNNTPFNVSFINIYGNQMKETTKQGDANILADFVGGVAGYANKNTKALKLKYYTGQKDTMRGRVSAGGLFGVLAGSVEASQVAAIELPQKEDDKLNQYFYDTTFGEYILEMDLHKNTTATLDVANIGNTKLIESFKYAGGIAGIAINANIDSCYAKASFKSGVEIGGIAGVSMCSSVAYSYAIPYVNYYSGIKHVGGLFGSAYHVDNANIDRNSEVAEFESYAKLTTGINKRTTDLKSTFSTVFINKDDFTPYIKTGEFNVANGDGTNKFDYIIANASSDSVLNSGSSALTYTFAGKLQDTEYNNIVKNTSLGDRSNAIEIFELFNHETSDYVTTYSEVFSGWSIRDYWTLDNTKYFPLLLNNAVENFEIIEKASDFEKIYANRKGKYKIIEDIEEEEMREWLQQREGSNWIFDVDFEGTLIGDTGAVVGDRKPKVNGLFLTPSVNNSAGLFRKTTVASISNISFTWGQSSSTDAAIKPKTGVSITDIGGLSCEDNGSTISDIDIKVGYSGAGGYTWADETKTLFDGGEVRSFGGLVTKATNTNIMASTFTGKVELTLNSIKDGDDSYFGAIVGRGEKTENSSDDIVVASEEPEGTDKVEEITSFTIVNCFVGTSARGTEFKISVAGDGNTYIGNLVGYVHNGAVASNKVSNFNYGEEELKTSNVEITNRQSADSANLYYGGLIGYTTETSVTRNDVSVKATIKGTTKLNNSYYAGLIAAYGGGSLGQSIEETNAYIDFDFSGVSVPSEDNTGLLVHAGAVAISSSTGAIKQCLITGRIDNVEYDASGTPKDPCSAVNVIAAGIVGIVNGTLNIDESMSTVDISTGSTATKSIYAGGIVGKNNANLKINNCVSSGKIVVTTSSEVGAVAIGGMVGATTDVETQLIINNSYTTTSLITDGLNGNAIEKANVGGVLGAGKAIFYEVYFSSDLALSSDKNAWDGNTPDPAVRASDDDIVRGNLINLSAYPLVYSREWRTNFYTKDGVTAWSDLEKFSNPISTDQRLPYITALRSSMQTYKVLTDLEGWYDYNIGTSLRPKMLTSSSSTLDQKGVDEVAPFVYYLYLPDEGKTLELVDGSDELHGILIGEDAELSIDSYNMLSKVNKHSAISNFHIVFDAETTLSIGEETGLLVKENEGVIYNCSVISKCELIVTGSSGLALIAFNNRGLISNSFATVEVQGQDHSEAEKVAGITVNNFGRISTSYFTGYLNAKNSAGIILNQKDSDSSYVYNCYMGGIVTSIQNRAAGNKDNSFVNFGFDKLLGSNNLVDTFANNEVANTNSNLDGTIVKTVTTYEIISNTNGFHSIVNKNSDKPDGTPEINVSSFGFGYNYGYPVIKANKLKLESGTYSSMDKARQLYTGDGVVNGSNLEERYTDAVKHEVDASGNVTGGYINTIKIPHLGVLSTIQGYLAASQDRAYTLIYDINGLNTSWTAVGAKTESATLHGFSSSCYGFRGIFTSNRGYAYSDEADAICTIENLANNGLFGNVNNAYIADINLGDFTGLIDSGALGTNVTDGTVWAGIESKKPATGPDANSQVYIDNISFRTGKGAITGSNIVAGDKDPSLGEANSVGALFGIISGNVKITDLDTAYNYTDKKLLSISELNAHLSDTAGLIAGTVTAGIVSVSATENNRTLIQDGAATGDTIYSNVLALKLTDVNVAGSLVGTMSGGTLDVHSQIYVDLDHAKAVTAGGVVGSLLNETSIKKGLANSTKAEGLDGDINIKTMADDGGTTPYHIQTFGGLAGEVHSIASAESQLASIQDFIISYPTEIKAQIFGGYVGISDGVKITGCSILTTGNELKVESNDAKAQVAIFAGRNVGGIEVGPSSKTPEISISKLTLLTTSGVTALDTDNSGVAMLIGNQVSGDITLGKIKGSIQTYVEPIAPASADPELTLHVDSAFVANLGALVGQYQGGDISFDPGCKYESDVVTLIGSNNVGGAFGKCKVTPTANWLEIINSKQIASIKIASLQGTDSCNFGGIFGELACQIKSSLTNQNDITFSTTDVDAVTASNVGGIAGLYSATFTNETDGGTPVDAYWNIFGVKTKIEDVAMLSEPEAIEQYTYENEAIIDSEEGSYTENLFKNSISDSSYIIRGVNVGGIFGNVKLSTSTTVVGAGGAEPAPASEEPADTIIIQNIYNIKKVQGFENVGGLIGSVDESSAPVMITQSRLDAEAETADDILAQGISGEVSYTGSLQNAVAPTDEKFSIQTADVVGVKNVGGIIGSLTENATIQDVYYKSSGIVYGNYNVGSLAGQVNKAIMKNNVVEGVEVKAIYFSLSGVVAGVDGDTVEEHVYIPTSVGGITGETVSATILNNVLFETKVTSVAEGSDAGSMISTISNYMKPSSTTTILGDKSNFNDEIETGFGGFIGTVDADTVANMETEYTGTIITSKNYMVDITVNAELGINVGTYYGYAELGEGIEYAGEKFALATPYLYGDNISVDGAYNIGGIIGAVDNANKFHNSLLPGDAKITLQAKLVGMHVGGLVGSVESNVSEAVISSGNGVDIVVNTSKSYYIGGLFGRLKGTGSKLSIGKPTEWGEYAPTTIEANTDKITHITGNDYNTHILNAENFGGLVGLLKVEGSADANVAGYSKYPFTVNTIENDNYIDLKSRFDENTEYAKNGEVYLVAQATYVNNTNISISGSQTTYSYNPIRGSSESYGWSKEYTGFRKLRRYIPIEQNVGAEWPSIETVYDAANIRHVVLSTSSNGGGTVGNATDNKVDIGKILYTIYEETVGQAVLYSPIGIARPSLNTDESTNKKYMKPKDVDANDSLNGFQSFIVWISGEDLTPYNIDYLQTTNLHYFNWGGTYSYVNKTGSALYRSVKENASKKYMTYAVSNYFDRDSTSDVVYFIFDVIYDNTSGQFDGHTLQVDNLPATGSVFDVTGIVTKDRLNNMVADLGGTDWEGVIKDLIDLIITIVLAVVTYGAYTGIKAAGQVTLKAIINGVKNVAISILTKKLTLGMAVGLLAGAVVTGAILIAANTNTINSVTISMASFHSYVEQCDNNFGLLAASYKQRIVFSGGKVKYYSDSEYVDTYGNNYMFISKQRPTDYNDKHYLGFKISNSSFGTSEDSVKANIISSELEVNLFKDGFTFDKYAIDKFAEKRTISKYDSELKTNIYYDYAKIGTNEYYYIMPNYTYWNDCYWINIFSAEMLQTKASLFTAPQIDDVERTARPYLIQAENGEYYLVGQYNASTESYSMRTENNNVTGSRGSYQLHSSSLKDEYVILTEELTYKLDDTITNADGSLNTTLYPNYVLGVDYFVGAYYTANETTITGVSSRYAEYKPMTDAEAAEAGDDLQKHQGSTYLSYTYNWNDNEGNPQTKTVHYKINSILTSVNSEDADKYKNKSVYGDETYKDNTNSIFVLLNPSTFINPYKDTDIATAGIQYPSNAKDDKTYGRKEISENVIKQNVEYFLYVSGYKSGTINIDTNEDGTKESIDVAYIAVGDDKLTDVVRLYASATATEPIYYKITTSGTTVTITKSSKGTEGAVPYVPLSYIKDKYSSISSNTYTANKITVGEEYKLENGILYQMSTEYLLKADKPGNDIDDGDVGLYNTYIVATKQNTGSYVFNKFLTNAEKGLYTRYKYTKDDGSTHKLSGKWKRVISEKVYDPDGGVLDGYQTDSWWKYVEEEGSYELLPNKQSGNPNGRTTYLCERVQVILGGSYLSSPGATSSNASATIEIK